MTVMMTMGARSHTNPMLNMTNLYRPVPTRRQPWMKSSTSTTSMSCPRIAYQSI
jgi:hypothetical protein